MKRRDELHTPFSITPRHRANLKKLAAYLLQPRREIIKNAKFNMDLFTSDDDDFAATCGTSGCAAGHGPFAGVRKKKSEDWFEYVLRAFGSRSYPEVNLELWGWCFDSRWAHSPKAAANRILYALEHGTPTSSLHVDLNASEVR